MIVSRINWIESRRSLENLDWPGAGAKRILVMRAIERVCSSRSDLMRRRGESENCASISTTYANKLPILRLRFFRGLSMLRRPAIFRASIDGGRLISNALSEADAVRDLRGSSTALI